MLAGWSGKPDSDTRTQRTRIIGYREGTEMGGYDVVCRFRNKHLIYVRLLRSDELHP